MFEIKTGATDTGVLPKTPKQMAMDLAILLAGVSYNTAFILKHLQMALDGTNANILPILKDLNELNQNMKGALWESIKTLKVHDPERTILNLNTAIKIYFYSFADRIHEDFLKYGLIHECDCNDCDNCNCDQHHSNNQPETEEKEEPTQKFESTGDSNRDFMLQSGRITRQWILQSFEMAKTRLSIQYNYDETSKSEVQNLVEKYSAKLDKFYANFEESLDVAELSRISMQAIVTFLGQAKDIYAHQLLRSTRK